MKLDKLDFFMQESYGFLAFAVGHSQGSLENVEVRHLMSGEWKDRRERRPFDIFEEFKEIEKIMNEIMRQAYEKNKRIRPRVYVFSIRTDPSLRANSKGWAAQTFY
jgi:hypothetical protein